MEFLDCGECWVDAHGAVIGSAECEEHATSAKVLGLVQDLVMEIVHREVGQLAVSLGLQIGDAERVWARQWAEMQDRLDTAEDRITRLAELAANLARLCQEMAAKLAGVGVV